MNCRSCVVVLTDHYMAEHKWINYEIHSTWKEGKGIEVVYINGFKD